MSENALARLIAEHRDVTGDSYAAIADRGGLPRSTVHKLATATLSAPPRPETLEKLAKGLNLSVDVVTLAAQEAAGYQVPTEATVTEHEEYVRELRGRLQEKMAEVDQLIGELTRAEKRITG